MNDDQAMQTPDSEMMESDLNHYEHLSTECSSWSSGVPEAIRFYWENKDAIAELEGVIHDHARKMLIILETLTEEERGEGRQFFDIIADKMKKDEARIKKMKDLYDPHDFLGL